MTWAPRNKSEDEDEDEGDASRSKESPDKAQEGTETSAEDEGERGRRWCEVAGNFLPRRGPELRAGRTLPGRQPSFQPGAQAA